MLRRARLGALFAGVLLGGGACTTPAEDRQALIAIDGAWRLGSMEAGSFEALVESIRRLGAQSPDAPARLAAVPELLRVSLENPSAWVRHEALRAAWQLAEELPRQALRSDDLDRREFNARTRRLEELFADEALIGSPETLALAAWLAEWRAPPGEPSLAVTIAEVVLSQALHREDELGNLLAERLPGSLFHALALVTALAATDAWPVVREQAAHSARHLAPEDAFGLLAGLIAREDDQSVLLAALATLSIHAPELDAGRVAQLVQPFVTASDVAVRSSAQQVLRR